MFTTIQKEENALRLFVFLKKILQGACADVFTRPTLLGFHACCAALRRSQNNRNVGTCWAKSLTGFKLCATSANIVVTPCKRTQQVTTLLGPTMLDWVLLASNVGPFARVFIVQEPMDYFVLGALLSIWPETNITWEQIDVLINVDCVET